MTWKKASAIGFVGALLVHALFFSDHLPVALIFPGLIAHPFIAGLHGGSGIQETTASAMEVLINTAIYALALYGISRLSVAVKILKSKWVRG
jgi:hypothetical protein